MIDRVASIPGPTASVVTLSDLKDHLRVSHNDEDARIEVLGLAATAHVEKWTQRILSPRSAVLRLSATPMNADPLELPGGVVNAISSLTVDGVEVSGLTIVGDAPARVFPATDWPTATGENFPVVVTYNVGHATVPAPLVIAIKLYAQWLYDGTDTQSAMLANMQHYRIRPV